MRMRGILVAMPALLLSSCLPGSWCSGDYLTEGRDHVNEVDLAVEGPELDSVDWVHWVSLEDNHGDQYDLLTITIEQADWPRYRIVVRAYFAEEGTVYFDDRGLDFSYMTESPEGYSQIREHWNWVADGTVTFVRADGEVTIIFDNLVITTTDTLPEGSPAVSSITLNGEYRAPVYCVTIS
jgi:hypothetical protein